VWGGSVEQECQKEREWGGGVGFSFSVSARGFLFCFGGGKFKKKLTRVQSARRKSSSSNLESLGKKKEKDHC